MGNRRPNLLCLVKSAHSKLPILLCIKCRQHNIRCTLHSTSWAPWLFLHCYCCSPDISQLGSEIVHAAFVASGKFYPTQLEIDLVRLADILNMQTRTISQENVFVMKTTMGVATTTTIEVCIWFMHMHINNKNPLFAPLLAPPKKQNKDFYELYSYTWIWSWKV